MCRRDRGSTGRRKEGSSTTGGGRRREESRNRTRGRHKRGESGREVGEGGGTSSSESGDIPTACPPSPPLFILSLTSGQGPAGKAGKEARGRQGRAESQRAREPERQRARWREPGRVGTRAGREAGEGTTLHGLAALPPLVIGILSPSA